MAFWEPTFAGAGKRLARATSAKPAESSSGPGQQRVHRLLLASCDPSERAAWRSVLVEGNYVISQVEDGGAAKEAILAGKADLVVAAVTMSKLDALELLREAQDLEHVPPIVVVARENGEIDQIYLRSAALLGAAATFMQPLDPRDFLNGIRAVLELRHDRLGRS